MINRVPCFYFPCTTVLIDDDKRLLLSLERVLSKYTLCKPFSKPSAGIEHIKKHCNPTFISDCIVSSDDAPKNIAQLSIDVYEFHKHMQIKERHKLCSVLVVDYSMPQMNGLDVCRELRDTSIRTILLTGEADEQLAVEAFNEGIINAFVRKDDTNLEEEIITKIKQLQLDYFQQYSDVVYQCLEWITDPSECLKVPEFHDYVRDIIKNNNIIEYYLFDTTGSFIFLDKDGKTSALAVRSEDSMNAAREAIEFAEEKVPDKVVKALESDECLLFSGTRDDLSVNISHWMKMLYPASNFNGYYIIFFLLKG